MRHMIIASTSTIFGGQYLDYLETELALFFKDINHILFIPYARPNGISHSDYTLKVKQVFEPKNKTVKGIHEFKKPKKAIKKAKAIFVGGGNTFVLLHHLQKKKLIKPLRKQIKKGIPYLGTSAGSNICGQNIGTTNDMPIIQPKRFKALKVIPFNINPHYIDPNLKNKHMGETRETRIHEFHQFNMQTVIGLREGSWLRVEDHLIKLKGKHKARIFQKNNSPFESKLNQEFIITKKQKLEIL